MSDDASRDEHTADEHTTDDEVPLTGGRLTAGVVRIGQTVRRPTGPHSPFVHQLLLHYEHIGLMCTPRFLGVDTRQQETLSFQPGWVPPPRPTRSWSSPQLRAAASLLRAIHDATAGTSLAGDHPTVCHNDFGPHNVVFTNDLLATDAGMPSSVIDFDGAAPGPRERDVALAAWLWTMGAEPARPWDQQLASLAIFIQTYGEGGLDLTSLGTRMAERATEVLLIHQQAGRPIATNSWLSRDTAWLTEHATGIDRWGEQQGR